MRGRDDMAFGPEPQARPGRWKSRLTLPSTQFAPVHATPGKAEVPLTLVDQEGADVVQGHVQGCLHRSDAMGRVGE
jgi:hypothetical protein